MGMSKMATGNIKIFISRLNDFEIAQETDCNNVQIVEHGQKIDEGKKKRRKTREAISCPESSGFLVSGTMPQIAGGGEKGRELPSLSPQSPLLLLQLAPHRLSTAHLQQSTATATNRFIFQVTDSSLQSVGIRLTSLECKTFLSWFSYEIMSS